MKNLLYSMLSAEGSDRSQQVSSDILRNMYIHTSGVTCTCVLYELDPVYTHLTTFKMRHVDAKGLQ